MGDAECPLRLRVRGLEVDRGHGGPGGEARRLDELGHPEVDAQVVVEAQRTTDYERSGTLPPREQSFLLEDGHGVPDRGLADSQLLREDRLGR